MKHTACRGYGALLPGLFLSRSSKVACGGSCLLAVTVVMIANVQYSTLVFFFLGGGRLNVGGYPRMPPSSPL